MDKQQISVKAVFDQVVEIESPEEREAYLDEACAEDGDLRRKVNGLLKAHEEAGSFLKSPPPGVEATIDSGITEGPGTVIGPYKLMEQIGEGGFGLVFVAEQRQPMRRKVALKIIKPGMDTKEVVGRFEAERQALALMDHPNIAKVLDAGTTSSGRPYFVMELVKGISIVDYCDAQHFTTHDRLDLFASVCQAVQHAHAKGVIHRDIKPSNVLVAPHDGRPVVKVIDFGVAKAIGHQLTDKTVYTCFSQMIGTPLYMSPEQAEINALDVDTRSDIYSLGVLLYELLTGTTPFERTRFSTAALDEIRRIIREEEPPKPSTRLSTLGRALPKISETRGTEPTTLSAQVKGDLDWIVMKCLEKDRNRRYETPSALASDVRRYLTEEPVAARPPSAAYKFHKFARRNRTLFTTGAIIALTLAVASVVSTSLALRLSDTNKQLEERSAFEQRQVNNLRVGHAFTALAEGDLDRLAVLLGKVDTDSFEYRLLAEQYRNLQPVFASSDDIHVTCGQFTPDGRQFVMGTESSTLYVYDVSDWSHTSSIKVAGNGKWASTRAIRFMPNGHGMVVGGRLDDGQGATAFADSIDDTPTIKHTFSSEVTDVAVAESSLILVAVKEGVVHACRKDAAEPAWTQSAITPEQLQRIDNSDHDLRRGCMVTTKGNLVVAVATSGNFAERAIVWELQSGERLDEATMRPSSESSVQFSTHSNQLGVGSETGIKLYGNDGRRFKLEKRLPFRSYELAFSPNGKEVAAADPFGGVRVLDLETAQQINRVVHASGIESITSLCYSPDGMHLASTDEFGTLKVWSIAAMRPVSIRSVRQEFAFKRIDLSPNSPNAAVSGLHQDVVRLWNPSRNEWLDLGSHEDVHGLAISQDGQRAASCGDGWVRIWDVSKPGRPEYERQWKGAPFALVAFSPSGQEIALATLHPRGNKVVVWNPQTGRMRYLKGFDPTCEFNSIDFSTDGRYLIAGGGWWDFYEKGNHGRTFVWDLERESDDHICKFSHQHIVYEVAFRPNSHEFAAGGLDTAVKIYNVDTKEETQLKDKSWWVTGLSYTPDGSRLVTVSPKQITFWDAQTHEQIGTFRINEQVRRVGILPDGSGMITTSIGGYVRFWKALPRGQSLSLPRS